MGNFMDLFKGGHESELAAEEKFGRIDSEAIFILSATMEYNFGRDVLSQPGMPAMEGTIPDHLIPGMEGIANRPQHEAQEILASGAAAVSEAVEASPLVSELTDQAEPTSEQDHYLNALSFPERGSQLAINATLNDDAASIPSGPAQSDLDLAG